jgi:hypothetical protein
MGMAQFWERMLRQAAWLVKDLSICGMWVVEWDLVVWLCRHHHISQWQGNISLRWMISASSGGGCRPGRKSV